VDHALRAAFTSGLDTAAVVAGAVGLTAGVIVLLLVRTKTPEAAHDQPEQAARPTSLAVERQ
jgi:hypothetical protein